MCLCRNLFTNPENERTRMLLIIIGRNSTVQNWIEVLLTSIDSCTCVAIGGKLRWYTALVQFNFKEVSHSRLCSSICRLYFKNIATPGCHTADSNGKKNHLCQGKTSVMLHGPSDTCWQFSFSLWEFISCHDFINPDLTCQTAECSTRYPVHLLIQNWSRTKLIPLKDQRLGSHVVKWLPYRLKNLLSILQLSNDHLVCHARQRNIYQPKKSPSDNKWARGN